MQVGTLFRIKAICNLISRLCKADLFTWWLLKQISSSVNTSSLVTLIGHWRLYSCTPADDSTIIRSRLLRVATHHLACLRSTWCFSPTYPLESVLLPLAQLTLGSLQFALSRPWSVCYVGLHCPLRDV